MSGARGAFVNYLTPDSGQNALKQYGPPELPPVPSKYARPGPYVTSLTPDQERKFTQWVIEKGVPFDLGEQNADYDMRGFWKSFVLKQPDIRIPKADLSEQAPLMNMNDHSLHYPDTYKTPYHKSFSNHSIYALPNAPRWNDKDQLIDASGNVVFDEHAKP